MKKQALYLVVFLIVLSYGLSFAAAAEGEQVTETGDSQSAEAAADQSGEDTAVTQDDESGAEDPDTPSEPTEPGADDESPDEDAVIGGDYTDSGEEEGDLYYKFSGVAAPESPMLERGSLETSLYTGSVSYLYDLEVPKGTNGLTPQVFLSYSSQSASGRAGMAGLGWDPGMSFVQRDVNYTPDDLNDDEFQLVLNGQSHDLVYSSSEGRFHTKVESYLYIDNESGSPYNQKGGYWIVRDGSGNAYRFGYYGNGQPVGLPRSSEAVCSNRDYVWRWYLDQVNDTYGNTIMFQYRQNYSSEDVGAVYPYKIIYNNDGKRVVEYVLEDTDRIDRPTVYDQGCRIRESRMVREIIVSANSSAVRRYYSNYTFNNVSSLLSSITLRSGDNSSALPSTLFEYESGEKGWRINSTWDPPVSVESRKGSRFIDVNGDGLTDALKGYNVTEDGNTWDVYLSAYINDQSGWDYAAEWNPPIPFAVHNEESGKWYDKGVELGDLNNDGFVDIFQIMSSSDVVSIWFNTGHGWSQENTSWPKPQLLSGLNKKGFQVADVNGDGRVDILQGYIKKYLSGVNYSYQMVWLNNGSGWNYDNDTWKLPVYFTCVEEISEDYDAINDTDVALADVNGDGLLDILAKGKLSVDETGSGIWINTGGGWILESDGSSIPINLRSYKGVRVVDVNNDGLSDILRGYRNGDDYYYNAWINNGSGWSSADEWEPTKYFSEYDDGEYVERAVTGDFNGDGLVDLAGYGSPKTFLNNGSYYNLLDKIHTSLGGVIEINYTPSTGFVNNGSDNVSDLGFPLWVVSSIVEDNNLSGAHHVVANRSFSYGNGSYDHADREFRGFGRVKAVDVNGDYGEYEFHQDAGRKGKMYSMVSWNSTDGPFAFTLNNWTSSLEPGGFYEVLLSNVTEYTFDGTFFPKTVKTLYMYDVYGNVVEASYLGDTSISGDERYLYSNYTVNLDKWIINKVARTYLVDSDGVNLSETDYLYDGHSSIWDQPDKGALTTERRWLGDEPADTVYGYYTTGVLKNVTDALGHSTNYTYDSTYTYPVNVTNAKGHVTKYDYGFGTGNLIYSRDFNGFIVSYEYDNFSRVTKEIMPYDTSSSPTVSYTYYRDGVAPEGVKASRKTGDSSTLDVYSFVDGFGRLVQTKSDAEDASKQIVSDVFYDGLGRVEKQYIPYLAADSSTYSSPVGSKYTSYVYDAVGRTIEVVNPDSTAVRRLFDRWNVTVWDENNHSVSYYLDGFGSIKRVEERNGGGVYSTVYGYNARGDLVNITDDQGNFFGFTYDNLGRKTAMYDPDMGDWSYSYDLVGNLVSQTDNGGNVTSFVYDVLNRLTYVDYPYDGDTSYSYDKDDYGDGLYSTLAGVSLGSGVSTRYYYDSRFRVVRVNVSIEGVSWVANWSYDSFDRVGSVNWSSGVVYLYDYNGQGLVDGVSGIVDNVDYSPLGKVSRKEFRNGVYTNLSYDPNSFRLDNIKTVGQADSYQDLDYGYDYAGNVEEIVDNEARRIQSFAYDCLDRLVSAYEPSVYNHTYLYDSIGNMLNMTVNGSMRGYVYGQGIDYGAGPHALVSKNGSESSGCSSSGGVSLCGTDYCCGVSDGFCPEDFNGVDCLVSDPDCSGPGGVELCGVDYYCGVSDGFCPEDFDGVSCSTGDADC